MVASFYRHQSSSGATGQAINGRLPRFWSVWSAITCWHAAFCLGCTLNDLNLLESDNNTLNGETAKKHSRPLAMQRSKEMLYYIRRRSFCQILYSVQRAASVYYEKMQQLLVGITPQVISATTDDALRHCSPTARRWHWHHAVKISNDLSAVLPTVVWR